MKTKVLLLLATMALCIGTCLAQSSDNEDEVVKIDKWNQQAYREGEILVKFRSNSAIQLRAPQKKQFQTTQNSAIDALFAEIGVDSVEQLMPRTGHQHVGKRLRAYNGSIVEVKDLSKLYRVTLRADKAQELHQSIERLQAMDEVEFAEPNYLVYTMALPYDTVIPTQDSATYVSEPLYSQQWGPVAIGLPQLWNKPKKSSKRPIIAILDTGVDIEHPDLAANIWTNTAEANGIAGQDDDANGYRDDIHGWDFVSRKGIIVDLNGHGTHCAGIAAAVGNNGIGVVGANPDALIMPVTVMQSNGTGDISTIAMGIDYAAANGADVISMSIGGYKSSRTLEQALVSASASAILVAAAGNDNASIYSSDKGPFFPAASPIVLGVEASYNMSGNLAQFSNFDEDGPIYSAYEEQYNYELRAPGVQILSTFPGGRYKYMNGTSMACPLAAGAISRLIQCMEPTSWEQQFGDLIHTRVQNGLGNMNIFSAYNITDNARHPELSLASYNLADTTGDNDGRADAGETLAIYPVIKNAWGTATNIKYWVKKGTYIEGHWYYGDTVNYSLVSDTINFGRPISSYALSTSLNPFLININQNCPDGASLDLSIVAVCDNAIDTMIQTITIKVENGVEIGGMLTENLTLYPNVHYIVTRPLAIPEGVTLTIKPGTKLIFRKGTGISCYDSGKTERYIDATHVISTQNDINNPSIIAKGKPDSLIIFTSEDCCVYSLSFSGGIRKNYYRDTQKSTSVDYFDKFHPEIERNLLEYILVENNGGQYSGSISHGDWENCIFKNNYVSFECNYFSKVSMFSNYFGGTYNCGSENNAHKQCNYIDNKVGIREQGCFSLNSNEQYNNVFMTRWASDRISDNKFYHLWSNSSTPIVLSTDYPSYLGAGKESIVREGVWDIDKGQGFAYFDLSNRLMRPVPEAHGIVWKILVDGIDAQDEFDSLPPIGVGTHRCDVYFNRPMNVNIAPTISFGVREPYLQHKVNENGSWSADSTIYTAYFTIDAKSLTDGLNTFRVFGAEDNEHFEAPEENYRFRMNVAAAGSMSTGLMAEAGLGKVTLTWETDEEDFQDLLGYNIYRWTNDTNRAVDYWGKESWWIDTICINTSLIDAQDTSFIDYDVVPGKAYYYIIRQMTTSLNSYDISNPVTATPLTAIKGDANGSMTVDVADIITEANYITLQNPQPFIFEAADVNSDNKVDVIDIVGTVNIILHPQANTNAITNSPAYYYVQNGILYVETDVVLGGVQLSLNGDPDEAVTPLDALNGFEKIGLWQTDEEYLFLAYSMSGKTLGVGTHALLQIGDADITSLVLSDAQGHNVEAIPQASTALDGTKYMPNSRKYLENGHLYIQIGNTVYSASGQLIK